MKTIYTSEQLKSIYGEPQAQQPTPEPQKTFGQKATDVVTSIFPGKKIGEAIGTEIARARVPEEQKQFVTQDVKPSQIAGDLLQIGAFFAPVGTVAKGLAVGGKALGLGAKTAQTVGNIGAGGLTGYTFDVGLGLSEDTEKPFAPGVGTLVGAGIPGAGAVAMGGARLAGEISGKTTGAGFGAIRQGLEATTQGGAKGKAFTSALRGQTTPESLVNEAKQGLQTIKQARTQEYLKQLGEISKNKTSLDISPIVEDVGNQLDKFGIEVTGQGLDFSRSPLRFNKQAQDDITTIVNEMKGFGLKAGDRTPIGVDSLKRAFDDLYTPSGEARAFVGSVRDKARKVLSQVDGYDDLAKNYANRTEIINEIQKGLSLGDKASVETSFKKLTSALRTNNEYREQFIKELDEATGGELLSKIAGQQLSEIVPRGLSGVLTGAGGALGLASGVGVVPILSAALTTSPRLVGEIVTALGFTGRKANQLLKLIEKNAGKFNFPGDVILEKTKKTPNKQGGFIRLPQLSEALDESTIAKTNTIKNSIPKSSPKSTTKSSLKVKGTIPENSQTITAYHGTNNKFENFDVSKLMSKEKDRLSKAGFWFTDSKTTAKSYGRTVKETTLEFKKPKTIDADGQTYGDFRNKLEDAVEEAQKNGNDGLIIKNLSDRKDWGNYEPATHYIALDKNVIKPKAVKVSSPENSLISEAKKYKSADEFVKAQGTPLFHGTDVASVVEKEGFKKMPIKTGVSAFGEGSYFTNKASNAKGYGEVVKAFLKKDVKLKKVFDSDAYKVDTQKLIKEGYDGTIMETGNGNNVVIFDNANIKTKSQLTDIWKKANNK